MASIDVYEQEPVVSPADSLPALENAPCTLHLGCVTLDEWEIQFSDILDQINAFESGTPVNVVNPEVVDRMRHPPR